MLDSGVRRGADILTALCLGARFVFVGRATLYGAAAGGLAGVHRAIEILRKEIDLVMGQIGCPSLAIRSVPAFCCNPRRRAARIVMHAEPDGAGDPRNAGSRIRPRSADCNREAPNGLAAHRETWRHLGSAILGQR